MKTFSLNGIRSTGTWLVLLLLLAGPSVTTWPQDRPDPAKGSARIPAAAAPARGNGGSGGQSGSNRQVSVPVVTVARPGQSGGNGTAGGGGGITGVTRVTRMSENNQKVRDFFRSSGLRLP